MTNWKADLAALVGATTAFTKSVRVEPPLPRTIVEPNRMPPVNLNSSERGEIRQREFQGSSAALHPGAEGLRRVRWKRMLASQSEAKKLDTPLPRGRAP